MNPLTQKIQLTNCSRWFLATLFTGNLIGSDPLLGPLQNNGGATFTHYLLSGSPAIDAGNPDVTGSGGFTCQATDQRGVPRPQGAQCDIGALEVSYPRYLPLVRR